MAAQVKYVRTRDGVFQYERRVPVSVRRNATRYRSLFSSKPLFRRTLATKDASAMFTAARIVHDEFEALIASARATDTPVCAAVPQPSRQLTDCDLADIADRYRHLTAEPFERLHRVADVDSTAAVELERLQANLDLFGADIRDAVRGRGAAASDLTQTPLEEAIHIAAQHGFNARNGSLELGAITAAVRLGMEQGYERIAALDSGRVLPSLPAPTVARIKARNLTIRELVERYISTKGLPAKTVSEVTLALRLFEAVVGNKAIAATTREDFQLFVTTLAAQTVGGKTAGSVSRTLSESTIKKRLGFLQSAISYASDRGWFDGKNPAQGIRISSFAKPTDKAVMPDKRRFTIGEMNAVLKHPWFTGCRSPSDTHTAGTYRLRGSEFWVPIVALYTGCRAAELGGLRVAEVRIADAHPHFLIRNNQYRRTKGGYARSVPILDALLRYGFADYFDQIRRSGADRLFPDWNARKRRGAIDGDFPAWSNAKIIRSFNRTVIPATLGDTLSPNARREVTFHSFRGAFKAMLSTAHQLPSIIVNEVVGHTQTELDGRYVGEVTIEETYPLVHTCDYRGLVLPSRNEL